MSSRDNILKKLRQAQTPFTGLHTPAGRYHMTPIEDRSATHLKAMFIEQAQRLSANVWQSADDEGAIEKILEIMSDEKHFIGWDEAHIGVHGLGAALQSAGIHPADPKDASVKMGLTGVDAALAATGSIIVRSEGGKPRTASLLPYTHIAVIRENQLLPDLETWMYQQREAGLDQFRAVSNTVIISGASRTADIAMELVLGAHGPAELHLILVP